MAQAIPDHEGHKTMKQEAREQKDAARTQKKDDNIVYVGKKPTMSYVLAVMTQLQNNVPEIHVKARGKSISRAVDVAEVVRNRFMQDIKRHIEIGTETVQDREKRNLNVSTIDIKLQR